MEPNTKVEGYELGDGRRVDVLHENGLLILLKVVDEMDVITLTVKEAVKLFRVLETEVGELSRAWEGPL